MDGEWSLEDKREITKVFAVLATIQKTYGKEIHVKEVLQAWEFVLSEKYTAGQVIAAMRAYMERSSDMPTPADLIAVIDPPKPKITQAEFIHAKEQHKLEGYPSHGYYGYIIRDYEKQESEYREPARELTHEGKKLLHDALQGKLIG